MHKEELKKKILDMVKAYPIASVATIKDGKPWVRYMVVQSDDNLTLFTTSFVNSRKIEQIKKDNSVHVTFGADPQDWHKPFSNVIGTAEILTDLETKKKCWHDTLSQFFTGPDDKNYVVIKISPKTVEYMEHASPKPEIYEV